MIFLGKLLQNDDLNIFFYMNNVVTTHDKDIINDEDGLLNDKEFTLNTWSTTTIEGQVEFDPYHVRYTIYDLTHGLEEEMRHTVNSKPMRAAKGHYWAPLKINPRFFRIGRHMIKWEFKQYFDSELQVSVEEFDVVRPVAYAGEFCESVYEPINQFHGIDAGIG